MKQEKTSSSPFPETNDKQRFVDPGQVPWVWVVFAILFAGILPLWPVTGTWLGLPAWAVFAVVMSFMVSVFTAYVILRVWQDLSDDSVE